jgi:L,D-transpeptidase YcbB
MRNGRFCALVLSAALALAIHQPAFAAVQPGISHSIRENLEDSPSATSTDIALLKQIQKLYRTRDYRPVWSGNAQAETNALAARNALDHAEEQGLAAADYSARGPARPATEEEAAQSDIALTRAVLAYARDVGRGRLPPGAVYKDVGLPAAPWDEADHVSAALESGTLGAFLAQQPPQHEEYRGLVLALARYRALAAAGGWPRVPGQGEIKIDSGDLRLEVLKSRLAIEDPEYTASAGEGTQGLLEAVKRYQARNGLAPDGRIGARTLEMLDIPVSERVEQIIANMERWRWISRPFEPRYIAVNAADQSLVFVDGGKVMLTSRVVVGRPQSPTPMFRAAGTAVTANPPWNVPHAIAAREILPKLKRNPAYLLSENMILLNGPPSDPHGLHIDWSRYTARDFPYRIRQLPGEKNALGAIKLELPNKFDVYLHDTPAKSLFERDERAFSHGCIRVQQIFPLAALALGAPDAVRTLENAIAASGQTQQFPLETALPIYVLYWTALAAPDGSVAFRKDIYGRDKRLIAALANRNAELRLALSTGNCQMVEG